MLRFVLALFLLASCAKSSEPSVGSVSCRGLYTQTDQQGNLKKFNQYLKDVHFWLMKHLKELSEPGKAPEVDHREPIVLGGQALGLENVHVLCEACHKEKTKEDNKKRIAILGNKRKGVKFSESHCAPLSKVRKGFDSDARRKAREKMFELSRGRLWLYILKLARN
jgi:5-methylcytosine-specific restriction endonuclease McrA